MLSLPSVHAATRRLVLSIVAVALVAGCGGAAASPSATASDRPAPVDPTPVIATPSPIADGTYWLRMTTSQAIPPVNLFAVAPTAVIDGSGLYLVPGAVPAIYPGPLVMPLFGRQVSDKGRETIIGWAKELGLANGKTDYTGGSMVAGGVTGHIELTTASGRVTLTGLPDATAPNPEPGSPQAFAELWQRIANLPETLSGELGAESPYTPQAYALLVGPAPVPEGGMTQPIADWPLDQPLATFGGPVANGTYRCGTVEGDDAIMLGAAFAKANQLTQWTQDPTTSATFGLTVRPIVTGENPCAEVFGQ